MPETSRPLHLVNSSKRTVVALDDLPNDRFAEQVAEQVEKVAEGLTVLALSFLLKSNLRNAHQRLRLQSLLRRQRLGVGVHLSYLLS
jgi:hypothetical protein